MPVPFFVRFRSGNFQGDIVGTAEPCEAADGDTMTLAEEQFAYSEDVLQDYGNLSTLAEMDKKSTIWTFFWD